MSGHKVAHAWGTGVVVCTCGGYFGSHNTGQFPYTVTGAEKWAKHLAEVREEQR